MTALNWEAVQDEASSAMLAAIKPVIRKVSDELYRDMLDTAEDYLADNIQWNIAQRIASAERETQRVREQNALLLEALNEISAAHLGDQPAAGGGSEYDWAVRHISRLRGIARKAVQP